MGIVHNDYIRLGGLLYYILLLYVTTYYKCMFGMKSLTSLSIISVLEYFYSEEVRLLKTFHTYFDKDLIGGTILRYLCNPKELSLSKGTPKKIKRYS